MPDDLDDTPTGLDVPTEPPGRPNNIQATSPPSTQAGSGSQRVVTTRSGRVVRRLPVRFRGM